MLARKEWGPVPPVVKEVVDSVIRVLLVEHWGPMINDAFERGGFGSSTAHGSHERAAGPATAQCVFSAAG